MRFLGMRWGLVGGVSALLLGAVVMRGLFQGLFAGEVRQMIRMRRRRTALWVMALGALAAGLFMAHIEDRARGPFQVRPAVRAELRAPAPPSSRKSTLTRAIRFSRGQ